DPTSKLVSVQSVVVDPTGNWLWILDTGSIGMGTVKPGGAKLLAVDLDRNRVTKKILFPPDVALSTSYLNDKATSGGKSILFVTLLRSRSTARSLAPPG